jgi:regulatory protein
MTFKKNLTPEQALQKLRHYCAYQERCHSEVREKLYELGVWKKEHDLIISTLIEENYLNEERFALAYAGGKFRIKKWGRVRIRYSLQQKQVSEYSIKKAMKGSPEEDYIETARVLAEEKYRDLKGEQYLVRKKKTIDHLVAKGYEFDLVNKLLNDLTGKSRS